MLNGIKTGIDRAQSAGIGVSMGGDFLLVARGLTGERLVFFLGIGRHRRVVIHGHDAAGGVHLDPVRAVLDFRAYGFTGLIGPIDYLPPYRHVDVRGNRVMVAMSTRGSM